MLVADANHIFEVTGNGDVLEPYHSCMGMFNEINVSFCHPLFLVQEWGLGETMPKVSVHCTIRGLLK